MDCMVKREDTINFDFHCKKSKQKYLLEIILTYGEMDLMQLASYLGITTNVLLKVNQGLYYLAEEPAYQLAGLFLMLFSD